MESKVNFKEIDYARIHIEMQENMIKKALGEFVSHISQDTDLEKLIDNFFDIPKVQTLEQRKFFKALSDVLYEDSKKQKYRFINKETKKIIYHVVIDYYLHVLYD